MKKNLLVLASIVTLFIAACGDKDKAVTLPPSTKTDTITVGQADGSGGPVATKISTNTTWTASKKYLLKGFVFVEPGVTLTIEPGTVIMGDKLSKGTLIIPRGAKIMAQGTADKPIVFTSSNPKGINPSTGKFFRQPGDWGGIILLGKAPNNKATGKNIIEGGVTGPTGTTGWNEYGGNDPADNSGVLKYVRIEFAGVEYSTGNEINSLTMGSVGSGTTISYVQVYAGGDDSFEWFGGTVNADHLVSVKAWDDDLDTDNGFSGKVQFALVQRHPSAFDVSGSNGFESDNDQDGTTATPQTKAIFSNITIIGPLDGSGNTVNEKFQHGAQIRRNSSQSVVNSLFVGYPIGVYIDDTKGTATSPNYKSGSLLFKNNIIAGCSTPIKATDATIVSQLSTDNFILGNVSNVMLTDAYKYGSKPNFLLKAGSPALTGASFTGITGFTSVAYRGAFDGTTDWTAKWTNWDAENTQY